MCDFDFVIGKHHIEKPMKAYKIFDKLREKSASFWKVFGRIPRGKWLRWDDKAIVNYGSLCGTHEKGFHCFIRPVHDQMTDKSTIPVQLKGDITIASQFDEEILVGEWIYVPTVEELEQMDPKEFPMTPLGKRGMYGETVQVV